MPESNIKYQKSNIRSPKVAITHDWLYGGGAEKVVEQLHKLYPEAPIYTTYCSDEWRERLDNKVVTGYLQKWPFSKLRRYLSVLQLWWFRSLNLSEYDIVISSSGTGQAKQLRIIRNKQLHVNYCHTPPHYLWRKYDEYMKNPGFGIFDPLVRFGLKLLFKPLRKADYRAAQSVDVFIANSSHIQKDIKTFYEREAEVVFPPVDVEQFSSASPDKRHGAVLFGRHVVHKRFDLAIKACNEAEKDLTVIGEGPETERLKAMAGPTITFTGRLDQDQLVRRVASSEFFIFPNEDDFGIVAVEAQAAGVPVLAYRAGGSLDIVQEGITGEFFDKQSVVELADIVRLFNYKLYNRKAIVENAQKFSIQAFRDGISKVVDQAVSK